MSPALVGRFFTINITWEAQDRVIAVIFENISQQRL